MRQFLKRKGIEVSVNCYLIEAMRFMALGLFASLLVGMIIRTIGDLTGIDWLAEFGIIAMSTMGPAIAVAVAYGLNAPPLVLFASKYVCHRYSGHLVYQL